MKKLHLKKIDKNDKSLVVYKHPESACIGIETAILFYGSSEMLLHCDKVKDAETYKEAIEIAEAAARILDYDFDKSLYTYLKAY